MTKTPEHFLEELKEDLIGKKEAFEIEINEADFKEIYACRIRLMGYVLNKIEQFQAEQKQVKDE